MARWIDIKGQKFGKYTALEYSNNQNWKCICDCGHIAFIKGFSLSSGNSTGCRKCSNRLSEKGQAGFNNLLSKYKTRCRVYNRLFDLSEEDFRNITSSDCHYCGVSPYKKSKSANTVSNKTKEHSIYTYNGIDRVDSSAGYTKENSVPCCEICNKAKRDMYYDEFINYLKRVTKFYANKN